MNPAGQTPPRGATPAITTMHIISTEVCGAAAYHAECPDCHWRCHRKPHHYEAQAVGCGERHQAKKSVAMQANRDAGARRR
jgi:hypothetical protein